MVFSTARHAYDNEVAFLDGHVAELLRSLEAEIGGPVVSIVASDHGEEFGNTVRRSTAFPCTRRWRGCRSSSVRRSVLQAESTPVSRGGTCSI